MVKLKVGIYLVTDPAMSMQRQGLPATPKSSADKSWHQAAIRQTVELAQQVCAGGVQVVQLRWKNADAGYFLELCRQVAQAVPASTQILVNDRIDVFLAAQAAGIDLAGVHIGQSDLPPDLVRKLIGPQALLGWSADTPYQLEQAAQLGETLDYLGVGTVRETATKTDAPAGKGVGGIAQIARQVPFPVVAIGGIKAGDLPEIGASPIHCAAVVSALVLAEDPLRAAQEFQQAFLAGRRGFLDPAAS